MTTADARAAPLSPTCVFKYRLQTGILKPWERSHAITKQVVYKQKLFSTSSWTSCAQRTPWLGKKHSSEANSNDMHCGILPSVNMYQEACSLSLSLYIYLHTTLRWTVHNVCLVTCYMYPRSTATLEPALDIHTTLGWFRPKVGCGQLSPLQRGPCNTDLISMQCTPGEMLS